MKKGKAADVFELTVENILYGGDELLYIIHKIIVAITREGHIPDLLKTGLLTPIFKNKGSKLHVANYRGITVTPVVCKIIESIMKNRPYMPTLERLKAVGGGSGWVSPPNFFPEGRKILHSVAFWIYNLFSQIFKYSIKKP
jgi:hypothetical protein